MEAALEMARSKDTKERMAGVERLHELLEASRKSLSAADVTSLVDCCLDLLRDNNFRVSQGGLQALSSAAVLSGEHLKLHFNGLVPAVVERLGDGKQPVRDAARQLLITLMEVSSPTIIVERAGTFAWNHRSWRVREEFVRTVTTAIGLFASTELTLQRVLLPPVLQLLNDSNHSVREAAASCVEEIYMQIGPQFHDELQRQHLPPLMMKEINSRLERLEPRTCQMESSGHFIPSDVKPSLHNHKKNSPKVKATRETISHGGEADATENPVESISVHTDKELVREFEKISLTLVPEKDWSIRISALQRIEGLVLGGAVDFPSFPTLLKQLINPLCTQLSDRRSSIVKQACHLLNFLSKELLGDFEACAEAFIPMLFKLVVITVLVIAESADNCIKTMLRNCKVARVLPRITDCAKNDRSAILRARCCDYALLILEYWADAPEIQRSAENYEDFIKCCVADAMSEVRATARTCYRMFAKTWPDRSRRLFSSFDPAIQRLIHEEDGGIHKRYASPSHRERGGQLSRAASLNPPSGVPGYGTSAIVAMDRSASVSSGANLPSSSLLLSQAKSLTKSERSLENVLHSSKQKVSAIESLLRGVNISDKRHFSTRSSSLDLGVDPPSSRDPPFPPAVLSSTNLSLQTSALMDPNTENTARASARNGGSFLTDLISQNQAARDQVKASYHDNLTPNPLLSLSMPYSAKRYPERVPREDVADFTERRLPSFQNEKQYLDSSYVPNFQRPLLRKQITGRASASSRNSLDDIQLSTVETGAYVDGPTSLSDALSEGLSPNSDWMVRVSAFNYLQTLLKQGYKGIQEISQHFEKVMKLFFQHLDDPHHKVAQAALSTLADIIPACRKPFESYLERILPHVFSRLIDPKELVRRPCSSTLEVVSKTYAIDSLLPALLRSLDEQRSPKAKLAVIQYANTSFNKHGANPDGSSSGGFVKLWLAKLLPLVSDKNTKLKEAAVTGIISVYSHFDSTAVLNFITSLSVEDQNFLRRALKQYTPRIEVDLMNFLQSKKERQRPKSFYDQSDTLGSSDDGYGGISKKSLLFGRYSSGSTDLENNRKWGSLQETVHVSNSSVTALTASDESQGHPYRSHDESSPVKEIKFGVDSQSTGPGNWTGGSSGKVDSGIDYVGSALTPRLDISRMLTLNGDGLTEYGFQDNLISNKIISKSATGPSIPQLLHQICSASGDNWGEAKRNALQQLAEASRSNDQSVWPKYFNQILTAVLEALDDLDSSTRELVLTLIVEMLEHQKEAMEESVEIIIEKLLHAAMDGNMKVSNEAQQCLSVILSKYDPFRCLSVVVPLLVSEDEKMLVTCINCLTKLVGRLSQEELMTQLPSFLPALFDAFGNQSADVRKTVVFCLVDIYIMLGKAFLPYLEGLNSTQLRLVTIYANRISQARSGSVTTPNLA